MDFLTNSTKSDKTGTAECTLPLSSNIVRLEGHDHDNIRLHGCTEEKHAKISHSARRRPAHEGESDDGHDGIEQDLRPANTVFIAEPALHVHDHGSEGIWRCDEALTLGDGEAHSEEEDDREEEGDCVRLFDCAQKGQSFCKKSVERLMAASAIAYHRRRTEKDHCKSPHFDIFRGSQKALETEGFNLRITAIAIDRGHDVSHFALREKVPGSPGVLVGKRDEKDEADDSNHDGENSFDDEDPGEYILAYLD